MKFLSIGRTKPDTVYLGRNCPDGTYRCTETNSYSPLIRREDTIFSSDGTTRHCAATDLGSCYSNWIKED